MAITIQNAAGNNSSVNDELLFVAYEATKANDPVTYPDYTYVCDVYVDSEFVARLKARPDPTYKMGRFDVATILRSYVSYGLKANIANYTEEYDAKIAYRLHFGEEYDFVLYPDVTVDGSDRTAFKSYAKRPFVNTNIVEDGTIAGNYPTGSGTQVFAYRGDKWLTTNVYDSSFSGGVHNHVVTFYNNAGDVIATVNKTTTPAEDGKFLQMNIGAAGFVSRGEITQAQLDASDYYIVTWSDQIMRVRLLCEQKYTPVTLAWLNPYGVYDMQSFGLVSMVSEELSRKDFAQLNFRLNASGEVSYDADGVFYGSKKGFATAVKITEKLTSHLLNDAEYTWLAEMFRSPDVYRYDTVQAKFFPVVITENNYDVRNFKNSRLKPLEFNIQYSDQFNAQYL
jgi:hypothetical protein